MTTQQRLPVVVGVDGSDGSHAALAHGAWEAQRRGVPLRLVHSHAVIVPYAAVGLVPDTAMLDRLADAAQQLVSGFAQLAQQAYPDLEVKTSVLTDSPGSALVQASREASLVVVGSRGLGGFAGLLLGSVSAQLAAHSQAPVIVIRPPDEKGNLGAGPADLPVVVGVDGIPDSTGALSFAFEQASARGVGLIAVYAWWILPPSNLGPTSPLHYDLIAAEDEARRMLSEATAGWRESYPDVAVELVPAHSINPTVALLEASEHAGLLVVSRHGGNALSRLVLGSIGDIAVRQATCPVAVIPEPSV